MNFPWVGQKTNRVVPRKGMSADTIVEYILANEAFKQVQGWGSQGTAMSIGASDQDI